MISIGCKNYDVVVGHLIRCDRIHIDHTQPLHYHFVRMQHILRVRQAHGSLYNDSLLHHKIARNLLEVYPENFKSMFLTISWVENQINIEPSLAHHSCFGSSLVSILFALFDTMFGFSLIYDNLDIGQQHSCNQ